MLVSQVMLALLAKLVSYKSHNKIVSNAWYCQLESNASIVSSICMVSIDAVNNK